MLAARILADSTSPYGGVRLTTMEVTVPRSVLQEICADRALSYSYATNQASAWWHTVIVSATQWSNFFAVNTQADTKPEIRQAVELMRATYGNDMPGPLLDGAWHLPLIQPGEFDGAFEYTEIARKVSAARCARVGMATSGTHDHETDLRLYDQIVESGRLSPLEHVATPFTRPQAHYRMVMGETALRVGRGNYDLDEEGIERVATLLEFDGNFRDWTQLRRTIPYEADYSLRQRS